MPDHVLSLTKKYEVNTLKANPTKLINLTEVINLDKAKNIAIIVGSK